jgi:hypothetical protein
MPHPGVNDFAKRAPSRDSFGNNWHNMYPNASRFLSQEHRKGDTPPKIRSTTANPLGHARLNFSTRIWHCLVGRFGSIGKIALEVRKNILLASSSEFLASAT